MPRSQKQTTRKRRPTIKDMLSLPIYYRPAISPDGKTVAYTTIDLDLRTPIGGTPCYIHDTESQTTYRAFEAASEMQWFDERTLAYVAHPPSGNPRWSSIFLVKDLTGQGQCVTTHSGRITCWSLPLAP